MGVRAVQRERCHIFAFGRTFIGWTPHRATGASAHARICDVTCGNRHVLRARSSAWLWCWRRRSKDVWFPVALLLRLTSQPWRLRLRVSRGEGVTLTQHSLDSRAFLILWHACAADPGDATSHVSPVPA